MSDPSKSVDEWKGWKEWGTVTLQTNGAYPEIGLLTLNRPEKLNAVSVEMMDDLHGCLEFLSHAFDCRVLVIRGAGKLFCSGVDLTTRPEAEQALDWAEFPDKVKTSWQIQHELSSVIAKLRRIPQPIISAVHRVAVGVGMAIANASDIVVASKGTRFINAFIKIGFSGADCGSSYFLPQDSRVPPERRASVLGPGLIGGRGPWLGIREFPRREGRGRGSPGRGVRGRVHADPKPPWVAVDQGGPELQHGCRGAGGSHQARGQEPGVVRGDGGCPGGCHGLFREEKAQLRFPLTG